MTAVLLMTAAGVAEAQGSGDDERARLHFESGQSYYEAAEYEDALREFQRAYDLSHRATLFFNISLCYQNMGDLAHAAEFLDRYLNEVTEIPNRANLEIRLANLRERIAAGGTTSTTTTTSGAGTTETGTTTGAGTTGSGSETGTGTGTETGSGTGTETGSGSGTETGAETGAGAGAGAGSASSGGGLNVGAIAGFSVAAVGVVMVGIFGGLTLAENGTLGSGCGATRTCTDSQLSTMQTYALLTDIGFGVALAGAAAGLVLLLVGGDSGSSEQASIRVTPVAGASQAGLSITGAF